MPGLCGYVPTGAAAGAPLEVRSAIAGRAVAAMVRRLQRFGWQVPFTPVPRGAALGQVAVSSPSGVTRDGTYADDAMALVLDGEFYAPFRPAPGRSAAGEIAARLEGDPSDAALADLHGSFSLAVWNESSSRLSIAVDRFGTRPVYWTQTRDAFVFASEIAALLAIDGVADDPDEEGIAQFLCFGQYLGDSTRFAHIKVAPAGAWLHVDCRSSAIRVEPFAPTPSAFTAGSADEWRALADEAATQSVHSACADGGRLGLSLSGGLDARTILGLAPDGVAITCVSLGIPGSIDHRAAAALAQAVGQPHHQLMLAGDFLERFEPLLREMVTLTDGQYLDQGIVLTTLPTYRELGIDTLLRGHAGELMHMSKAYAFSLDADALSLRTTEQLNDWLWRHLTGYMIGSVDHSLFGGRAARMRDMARSSLERQTAKLSDVEPVPQRIWHLFVTERLRRETMLSLQLFRNYVEVRVPFLDPRLVNVLLAAPPVLKVGDDLQTSMLRRHRPSFLTVVNANTGAAMGAGPLRTSLAHFRMRLYAKLGVAGYQPYERLGLWLADGLQPLLRRVLLDRGSATPFEPVAIAQLVDQHRTRRRNHTFLLMSLMTLSLTE